MILYNEFEPFSKLVNSEYYNDFETFSKLVHENGNENENVTTNKILGLLEILAIKNIFELLTVKELFSKCLGIQVILYFLTLQNFKFPSAYSLLISISLMIQPLWLEFYSTLFDIKSHYPCGI